MKNPGAEAPGQHLPYCAITNEKCIPAVDRDAAGRIFSQKSLPEYLTVTMITCFSVSSTRYTEELF